MNRVMVCLGVMLMAGLALGGDPGAYRVLLALGLFLVLPILGGQLACTLRWPRVVGFVAVGLLLGPDGIGWVKGNIPPHVNLFVASALAWLAFHVGVAVQGAPRRTLWSDLWSALGLVFVSAAVVWTIFAYVVRLPPHSALWLAVGASSTGPVLLCTIADEHKSAEAYAWVRFPTFATGISILLALSLQASGALSRTPLSSLGAVWALGVPLIGMLVGAVVGRAFRWMIASFGVRRGALMLLLAGCAAVYALVFHSDIGVAFLGVTAGALSVRDRETQSRMLAYTQTFSEVVGGFWIGMMATQVRVGMLPLWGREAALALAYVGAMVGGKLLGVYAAVRSSGMHENGRMRLQMSGALPQLFIPLTWMASSGEFEEVGPALRGLVHWGVLWGSLFFPLIAKRAIARPAGASKEQGRGRAPVAEEVTDG